MGLTVAEAFILISFCLLLLFTFWQVQSEQEKKAILAELGDLRPEQRVLAFKAAEDGSLAALLDLQEQGIDLRETASVAHAKDYFRFIEEENLRQIMEGTSGLSEQAKLDLLALVEVGDSAEIIEILANLKRLQEMDTTIADRIQDANDQRKQLVDAIQSELGEIVKRVGGSIDEDGSIILPENVVFETGKAEITDTLNRFLSEACVPWLNLLERSNLDITSVQIEGHASSEWNETTSPDEAYRRNLALSQKRSQNVLNACLDYVTKWETRVWSQRHMVAVGYSSAKPILLNGLEDKERSRRVVFSVSTDREKLLDDIGRDAGMAQEESVEPFLP